MKRPGRDVTQISIMNPDNYREGVIPNYCDKQPGTIKNLQF